MATKSGFTQEEWTQLQRGVTGATALVSLSDPGFFETFREAGAAGRHLADARRGNESELVRELAASPALGFGLGMAPQELESETLDALRSASSTLKAKAPEEAPAYRQFVLDVARSGAEAAEGVGAGGTGVIERSRWRLAS